MIRLFARLFLIDEIFNWAKAKEPKEIRMKKFEILLVDNMMPIVVEAEYFNADGFTCDFYVSNENGVSDHVACIMKTRLVAVRLIGS